MLAFLDTERLVSRNIYIFGHRMFGSNKCFHFWTLNVQCQEVFAFLNTKCLVLRNVCIFGHWTFGVKECLHFCTPNIWCQEMFAVFDTKRLVSRYVCIFGHSMFGVEKCFHILINDKKCIHRNKLHAEIACNFSHMRKKCFGK